MNKKWIFPILGLVGILWTLYFVNRGTVPQKVAEPVAQPSIVPFESYIAGAGLTEPNSENISVGTDVAGVVREVLVQIGDSVKKDQPLFVIDDRTAQAELLQAEAKLREAEADLSNQQQQLSIMTGVRDMRAVSKDELTQRENNVTLSAAKLASAEAALASARTALSLHTVRSPIDGVVMTMNLRLGEFASAGNLSDPLIRLGNLEPLHLRVDVDENDAWRFNASAQALAFVRGNSKITTPLTFVRVEPYVRPKRSLTGESVERVDTRVLQVIYRFDTAGKPIYPGQQMDVYIAAPALNSEIPMVAPPAAPAPAASPESSALPPSPSDASLLPTEPLPATSRQLPESHDPSSPSAEPKHE